MRVIVMASQKGGTGKTTLSGHLAVEAERAGAGPVALIDTDPQGSLADWWNERESPTPLFARARLEDLEQDLATLAGAGVKLAVVDTPPALTHAIRRVVEAATLVAIPIRPSPHDLRAAVGTIDMAEALDKPFVFVVNAATARARITADAAVTLSQHGTVAPVTVHHRTDFASCMINGRTVMEGAPKSRSADEIAQLWRYLDARLEKVCRKAHGAHAAAGGPLFAAATLSVPAGGRAFGRRYAEAR